jgi:hypothetical protein
MATGRQARQRPEPVRPRAAFTGETDLNYLRPALQYGLFDLERLERLILRTIAKDYFVLPGTDTDDDDE